MCWEREELPDDLPNAIIVPLYKNKVEKSNCSNYRGIIIFSIAGKIRARVPLNRLIPGIEEDILPESQYGFRANRGIADMIFVLCQIQEKCREQNMGLYTAFIDLTKAFDTMSRDGLWRILSRIGCSPYFLTILQQLHTGKKGQLKHKGELSNLFPIEIGARQGCVLAPTLFATFFAMMLCEAKDDLRDGIYIRFRADGGMFNLRLLLSRTKTSEQLITDLLLADDCAHQAHTEEALQRIATCLANAATAFGLTISLKKTEVICQKAPRDTYHPPSINKNGPRLNTVDTFTYLGSVISIDVTARKDVDSRLAKASSSFGRLQKRVWKNHSLRIQTKIKVYRAVVIATLLYGSEALILYRKHVNLLEQFHQRCLRSILGIQWQDYTTNEEVLVRANIESIGSTLMQNQLRWAYHVSRTDASRLPKVIFCGELKQGKRDRGAPLKKRFKDQLKRQLSLAKIDHSKWEQLTADRALWRATTRAAAGSLKKKEIWQQLPNAREESRWPHNPRNPQHWTKSLERLSMTSTTNGKQ